MDVYSSGIGDPYWYEWSVGLIQIVEMLNPDSNISSVTLQGQNIQGWDDVVVEFYSGKIDYYQIKHTRVNDTISYGDLVTESNNQSLLSYLASCWKEIIYNQDSRFILFTNRVIGNRKTSVIIDQKTVIRPGLKSFFEEIKINCNQFDRIESFKIYDEFNESYKKEWLKQLSNLDSKEKVLFQRQLEIETGQSDLKGIEEQLLTKISSYLGITKNQALSVLSSLDNSLRIWATTYRAQKEKITREDVYEKLRMPAYEIIGDHKLMPPYPFFKSREPILKLIIDSLKDTSKKVLFLTGPPGVGKTSLISKLVNRCNPSIHLRYYTFKPISPENDLLPADAGKTSTSRSLWGDLLSQLRDFFKGNLAKYNVPIRNDFITDVNTLRSEVLRLSTELSLQNGFRTVICIDGIDHAARAELDIEDNYLESLIPPDNIPDNVLFLISGQPPEAYDRYPCWLKENGENICRIDIPNLDIEDIKLLLPGKTSFDKNIAAHIVLEHTNGNTLSVLYAIHTLDKCLSIEEARKEFETYKLKDGLNIYYENIWNYSVSHLRNIISLPIKIACVFSLSAARLSAENFNKIIPEITNDDWNIILTRLSPMIVKLDNSYSVLHNDVKVYFTKIVKNASSEIYKKISLNLLELYSGDDTFVKQRHSELLRLLDKSNCGEKILNIICPRFILEAYINECPLNDVEEQIIYSLNVAIRQKSIDILHHITCCIKSFIQLQNSLQQVEKLWDFRDVKQKLLNELRVIKRENWNLKVINDLFEEILFLFRNNENNRASGIIERWLKDINYDQFLSIFSRRDIITRNPLYKDVAKLSTDLKEILENYGRIKQYYNEDIFYFDSKNKLHQESIANITTGFLSEAKFINDKRVWFRTFRIFPSFYYKADLDKTIYWLFKKRKWLDIYIILKKEKPESFSDSHRLFGIISALFSKNEKLIDVWYSSITIH